MSRLFKTKGIVLNYIKYKESSIIVKIYTENFGIQSFIVNSVRSKSAKPKIALYQPLTLLDLVVYHKESIALNRISEIKPLVPLNSISYNFKKSCIAIFLTEVLTKTLKEETSNPELFNFLYFSILSLDNLNIHFENFHLQFLINFSNYLGFAPETGRQLIQETHQKNTYQEEIEILLDSLINSSYSQYIPLNNRDRREVLDLILKFYQFNVEGFSELKSIEVLKDVME